MNAMRASCPRPVELSRALATGNDGPLREHLRKCTSCAQEWDAHGQITQAARSLPVAAPTPEQIGEVRAAMLAAAGGLPATGTRRSLRVLWVAAAICAAGVGVAVGLRMLLTESQVVSRAVPAGPVYRASIHPHQGAQFFRVGSAPDEIVRLTEGAITVEVAVLQPGERFRVITDDGEVEVRGTAFDVAATDDRLRSVRVLHGTVEVRPGDLARVVLAPGERWDAELARAQERAPELVPARRMAKSTASVRRRSTAKPPPADAPARVAPKRPIEVFFDEGWAALAKGEPSRAATAFEHAAQAAPDDPLAEDAQFWRGAALARAVRPKPAISALKSFLARYPSSARAGEASAMLGWLLLDAGDLDGADARFRAAAGDPADSVRASSRKGLETALQRRAALRQQR